ncbi:MULTISPECIES: AMP-dependent synthetase/ligase [Mogibacterium]|jgi:Long-chain acyl-CoA synthetases (AMP-forming)|uniref:AMP-dependent synthetase/ligase n=1 Tax=Mogibacterium TaxID=86331 RepID=UPI00027C5D9C|nr:MULTISPECIES: AMP-binding protein [Mogibacterium]EJU21201.1 AMP-binding enzyme [Mogibacterium sp. CM50]
MNKKKYENQLYDVKYVETIKEMIDASVEAFPDRVAYMYKDEHKEPFKTMTYAEFKAEQNAIGAALIERGFKGSKVAVIGENSHRWALSYYSVVCGVGVIVPIDRNLEPGEITNLLERADVEAIFASPKLAPTVVPLLDKLPLVKQVIIMAAPNDEVDELITDNRLITMSQLVAEGKELVAEGKQGYIDAQINADDLSTILFTSGTTGLAKGVMLSHRNLSQNVFNMSKYVHIPEAGRVLDVLPMHHVYEMTCTVMTSFYQGATVVICEGLKYIQKNFVEAECNIMLGVPLIFENIYRKIWTNAEKSGSTDKLRRAIGMSMKLDLRNNRAVTKRLFKAVHGIFGESLHLLIAGGAAIDPNVIAEFEAMGLPMMQGYGMTENSPIIAVNQDRYGKAASVGKPMPGTEVRIIDKDSSGIGEVICKGPSVMMGYYKDAENTAKTIKDGWLYTGDYGYFDEDGFLYITGRKKNVIVTKGGKNIFPEEVEYYLLLSDYICEVIVYGKPEEVKDDLICTAIMYPDYKALEEAGAENDEDKYKLLKEAVEEANSKMPPYKRVKRIEIREDDFIKTTTLKIKRFEKENYEYQFDDRDFEKGRRF